MQGVEEEAGFLAVDLVLQEKAHDLTDGGLDGGGILEDRKLDDAEVLALLLRVEIDELGCPVLMEVTAALVAHRWRVALRSVGLDVLAAGNLI